VIISSQRLLGQSSSSPLDLSANHRLQLPSVSVRSILPGQGRGRGSNASGTHNAEILLPSSAISVGVPSRPHWR